jgi:hypothetical protein
VAAQRELPARRARAELLSLLRRSLRAASVAACALAVLCAQVPSAAARPARAAEAPPGTTVPHSIAWSTATTLSTCAAADAPRATFPRDKPTHATGRGAIVWATAGSCAGAAATLVSTISANDVPGRPSPARAPGGARLQLRAPLALAPAPHGQFAIAGSAPAAGGDGQLVQGSAGGTFSALGTIAAAASQNALATGYLGDLAAASPTGGASGRAGVRVDVERYFANALSPSRIVAAQSGSLSALTVSLDFRTDAIVAWRQKGALYAHDLPASGREQPTQRLASVGPTPRVTALISDDNRAIVAWADQRGRTTSVYLDASAGGVRFGSPRLLERFSNPAALPYPAASPRLVRLSSESVMIAWSGAQHGHWVVRTAAIDLNGLGSIATVSNPATDSLLSDLQPGPDGEALALWTEPQPKPGGGLDTHSQALLAARGIDAFPDRTIFGSPEQIAPPGANDDATLAFDPNSDRALALWRGQGGLVQYAVRIAGPAPRR